ncbi:MAG: acetoacetate--CoA ligase [Cyanothece sp. SIO1E1]|nr:acetoacetate--CoA ligase [Cyanothece sp. SIO1E1]
MPDPTDILWTPSADFIKNSGLKKYERWLGDQFGLEFGSYEELWKWSNDHFEDFWESLWKYFDIKAHSGYNSVIDTYEMPGARWFNGATLNYAEHIFRMRSDDRPALIFANESEDRVNISWKELENQVSSVQSFLKEQGIQTGDRVAGYLPNTPEAIICFLAVNSLGAVWSCCSPDFGVSTVIDRFTQIEPRLFFTGDGYQYGGKRINRLEEARQIANSISSIETVVLIPTLNGDSVLENATHWKEVTSKESDQLSFEPVGFNHPIWVLYSSGTTGKPKAITHSHGGVLLEHLKYMHFHNDVRPGEHFFWFTTTGWMMWNFLQASMLAGAVPVLFDGSPGFPDLNVLWKLTEELPIHHFGTSAPYLIACMKKELTPGSGFELSQLRSIGSTGAPLPPEAFDWVYNRVKKDLWLCSMSGGTDVCTAFVGGIPSNPVRRGNIQGRALGCDLRSVDEDGNEITASLGEMVISNPMPSMPIYFWNDEHNERYSSSYFEKFPGKWCHGDWIQLFEDGSLQIMGRSDATLNRKGIRIGTAEIYSVLDRIPGLVDSLIVNLEKKDGSDIMPLFVVIEVGIDLDRISETIKQQLKEKCSPRHVPDLIKQVDEIPYTLSGKKMEVPVKKALMGLDVSKHMNRDASRNPKAMDVFMELAEKL